ncbi:hypothetical protein IQ07DRAFT_559420 [Pyrenochaeta sp. DS3sAY3a]|nr:hypothetical protein IQ07DRAFT_559420 [Pyrenochaeta sp. DS3sAY3a]
MIPLLTLLFLLPLSLALPQQQPQPPPITPPKPLNKLIVLDAGVGHRSTPVPRWRTSLRSLTPRGTNASIIREFGPDPQPNSPAEPVGAQALAYSPSTGYLFAASGSNILRTDVNGSVPVAILSDKPGLQITSVTVAEQAKKIYFGTLFDGQIKRADFDGRNIEVVRNVSQGLNYDIARTYVPANSYPAGILIDEEKGWLYWSASRGADEGSVRRTALEYAMPDAVLAEGIKVPTQLRLVGEQLYWAERGRWSTSPTALKRFDLSQLRKGPPSSSSGSPTGAARPFETVTVVHSDMSNEVFSERDYTGDRQTLSINSFVIYRDGVEQRIWFVIQSSGRTMFGKLVEVHWRGSGDGRHAEFEVLNKDTKDLGIPIGLEYI